MATTEPQERPRRPADRYWRRLDATPDRAIYRIKVKGCLDDSWSEWFDGLAISADVALGETVLSGSVADQAALHGLLNKVRDLGLILLWLRRFDASDVNTSLAEIEAKE